MGVYGPITTLDPFADWIPDDKRRGQASRMTGGGGALFWQRINGRLMGNYILVYPNLRQIGPKIAGQDFRGHPHPQGGFEVVTGCPSLALHYR